MKIAIIGLGLIGGSIAKDLKKRGFASEIIGVENSERHAAQAFELGLVDKILPLDEAISTGCEIVVAAVSVDALVSVLPIILNQVCENQTVVDVGSTKMPVLKAVKNHPRRSRFVASHPMAGTEYSGPAAAVENLFEGRTCVFCEIEKSAVDAAATAHNFWVSLGMRLVELGGHEHDLHVAYVSHISHIASFALALTVLEKERSEERIFDLAAGGFSSTVRLAKSNPQTWVPIFRQNRDHVLDVLDEFINTVSRFRTLLIKRDFETFEKMMAHANDIRRIIG